MAKLFIKGYPLGDVKGILFDKDGTLSNSEHHLIQLAELRIEQAVNFFEQKKFCRSKLTKLQELLSAAYGITNGQLSPGGTLAIASKDHNLISTATVLCILGESWPSSIEIANIIFNRVNSLENQGPQQMLKRNLLPGVFKMLGTLQEAKVLCALISNDTKEGIKSFLEKNNLENKITTFWSAEDHPAKPDPAAVIKLCKALMLEPSECALIGDADSDLQMAHKAGIGIVLGYTSGWTQPAQLTAHQHLIKHWDDLTIQ